MVDRSARDHTIATLEAYLDDRITAFELDERLDTQSDDKLVDQVASLVWCYYDDCTDHKVRLTREEWDLFQRLLLLLRSDVELAEPSSASLKQWEGSHQVAFVGFLLYVVLALWVGWNAWLLVLALPFAVPALLLQRSRSCSSHVISAAEFACYPFASWTDLRRVRQDASGFVKRRYRVETCRRQVPGPVVMGVSRPLALVCNILFSPLVLLGLALPSHGGVGQAWNFKWK